MKHLKLFFALFAMLALGVTNAWGADFTLSSNASVTVDGVTVTFAKADGSTAPTWYSAGLRLYAKNTITISSTSTITSITFNWEKQGSKTFASAVANCGNYTHPAATGDGVWTGSATEIIFTLGTSGQLQLNTLSVTTSGGETPEPEPGTGGEALSFTWDLSTKTYTTGTNEVTWTTDGLATMHNSGDKATNYLGGDANNRSSSRFYTDNTLSITPAANVTITSVEFTATSSNYANVLNNSTWTNASASVSGTTVTVTPTNGASAISATIGGTCGFTGVTVHYTKAASGEPEPVIVKTLKSIAVTGMTTTFEQGDVFKFDGTCTATYSVTKDGAAQDDETAEVTPASVSTPDMNQIGTQTITVTYETVSTTYDITIKENEVTPGTYDVLLNNVLWNVSAGQQAASVESMTGKANDITFYTTKGSSQMYASATQTRFYNGATFVISVPTGYVIKSIKFTEPTSDKKWEGSISASVGTYDGGTKSWSGNAQEVIFSFAAQNRIANASITFEAIDLTLPSAPTFNPEAGTYNAVQNVTISAEAGTTIYYTLDGTDPTTTSDVYASAIEIAETKTLKAIAVKDEKVSPIASATYTIKLPLTTMDQIFEKATAVDGTATSVEITFGNWVVSAVKEDGKTAFVTDGTKGFVIFDKDVNLGFSVGNILSGTATCKVQLYNGFAELTELKSNTAGLSVGSDGTITTQELDATAIETLTGVNTGSLIKINGICSSSDSKYYVAGVQIYTSLYNFGTLEVGAEYNITGIYQQYYSTKEMLPRSAEDIEEVVGLPTATIEVSNITMEVGQEKAIEATITPDAAQSTVQYAITSGNEYITLEGTTITAIAAGTATITATIAEKADEYKGATKEFTVTVKPQNIAELPFTFNGGKADIENTLGMSQTGLSSDYDNAPKLKFNGAGDNVIVHFDSQAGEFSFLLKQNGQNAGTFTVYESANGEDYTSIWSGGNIGNTETITPTLAESARYVKFEYTTKGEGTNYALGSISIAKPDNRQEAGLAWDPSSVTLTQGDAFNAPTLQNPKSVAGITYASSNDEVATVTAEGEIALASATGTATITATFAGDATYKPATATCKITVNEYIETIDGEWQLVTDASKLQAGMEIIIASVADAGAVKTMGEQGNNNRSAVASTVDGDKLNPAVGTTVITLEDCQLYEGLFALKTNDGYLYAAGSSSNHLRSQQGINNNACWTITITEGVAAVVATNSSNRNIMRYNENSDLFSCYASGQKDIALYAKVPDHSRTTSAGRYGTICLPGNIVKCLGATLYEVAGREGDKVIFDEVTTPDAGMPYIFLAHNAEVLFYCGDQTADAGNHNSLYGTFTVLQNSELEGKYMVQNNKIVKCNPANSGVAENRAYFNGTELNGLGKPGAQMPGRRRITMGTESENTATGTEDVVAPEGQTLKLIENGQLIIIRNGEKFNAQGIKF